MSKRKWAALLAVTLLAACDTQTTETPQTTAAPTTTAEIATTTTTERTGTADSPIVVCMEALAEDIVGMPDSFEFDSVGDHYVERSLAVCSEDNWLFALESFVRTSEDINCESMDVLYYAAEYDSEMESRMHKAAAACTTFGWEDGGE